MFIRQFYAHYFHYTVLMPSTFTRQFNAHNFYYSSMPTIFIRQFYVHHIYQTVLYPLLSLHSPYAHYFYYSSKPRTFIIVLCPLFSLESCISIIFIRQLYALHWYQTVICPVLVLDSSMPSTIFGQFIPVVHRSKTIQNSVINRYIVI